MNDFKMRCSSRDNGIITLITSTPLSRSRKQRVFEYENVEKLSPILETSCVGRVRQTLSNKALFPNHKTRFSESSRISNSTIKKKSFTPLVIANSDSEDEDNKNSSDNKTRKSLKDNKGSILPPAKKRRVTSQNLPRPNFLDEISGENKKSSKRVSRVDAILDEFVKNSLKESSLDFKMKSEESIDAMIEQVVNHPPKKSKMSSKNQKTTTKSKAMVSIEENKENLVRKIVTKGHEVDLFLVKNKKRASAQRELATLHPNIIENKLKREVIPKKSAKIISENLPNDPPVKREEIPKKSANIISENLPNDIKTNDPPEIRTLDELEWHIINGQEGVCIARVFSAKYIKINPKCRFTNSPNSSILNDMIIIIEGNAHITIDGKQTKIGPGSQIFISRDYEIMNKGVSKNLILLSLKK